MSEPEDKGIVEKVKDSFQAAKEKFSDTTQRVRDQAQQASATVKQKTHRDESEKDGMTHDATMRFDDVAAHTVDDHAPENATEENSKLSHTTRGGTELATATTLANDTEDETEKAFVGD